MNFYNLFDNEINILNDLKTGTIFSANDPDFLLKDVDSNWVLPNYAVYLGELNEEKMKIYDTNIYLFLVELKNGNIVFWVTNKVNIKKYLQLEWFKKTNKNLIPYELLQEIRLQKDKEYVNIVGDETIIQLPSSIKNELLVFLGQPSNTDFFPNHIKI